MSIQARPQSLQLVTDESLCGILALGLLEADGISGHPLPPAFFAECAAAEGATNANTLSWWWMMSPWRWSCYMAF